jgi:ABC-type transporter Mla subunit MlaD
MSDRTLGYVVIVFLIIFLLVPAVFLSNKLFNPVFQRTIVFEEVNTLSFLRIEDPVKVRGIDAGFIRSISWKGNQTFVVIESDREIDLFEGYRIFAEDKGLMGDRYVSINPGDAKNRPIDKNDTLRGIFLMGPTEAVAHIRRLEELVDTLAVIINTLRVGTLSKKPFTAVWSETMASIDTATYGLSVLLKQVDREITKKGDSISAMVEQTADLAGRLNSRVPGSVAEIENVLAKTKKILSQADTLVTSSGALAIRLKAQDSILLHQYLKNLENQLSELRGAIHELQKQGLHLPVRIQ